MVGRRTAPTWWRVGLLGMLALLGSGLSPATPGLAASHVCPTDLSVWRQTLGAEWLACHQLADLTTTGNPYTDPNSLYGMGFPPPGSGTLNSHYTNPTSPAVAGLQLEGYFADGCNAFVAEPALVAKNGSPFVSGCTPPPSPEATCVSACHHDGQFVVRIPDTWDGHLLAAGTPGVRDAFASDFILSDYAMEKGWAYVSQDKGNLGADFFRSGCDETGSCASQPWAGACTDPSQPWCAGAAVQEWNPRMRQATRTAQALLRGLAPTRGDPARYLAHRPAAGGFELDRLGPHPQGPTNQDGPKQAPKVLIHCACQACDALLIGHRRLPQVHRPPIRQRQGEARRGEPLVAVEQRTAVVLPQDGTPLGDEQMVVLSTIMWQKMP